MVIFFNPKFQIVVFNEYFFCNRVITDVLIDYVSDDEKIRIDRKAVKLVKLAILPSDVSLIL